MAQSEAVTQLSAEVTMASYALTACPANTASPLAALEVGGHFFNDGSSTELQDQTGDIHVRLALEAQERAASERSPVSLLAVTPRGVAGARLSSSVFSTSAGRTINP